MEDNFEKNINNRAAGAAPDQTGYSPADDTDAIMREIKRKAAEEAAAAEAATAPVFTHDAYAGVRSDSRTGANENTDVFDDETEPAPSKRRLSSREAAALRKQKKRKRITLLAVCFVALIALAVGGYFLTNYLMDRSKLNNVNEQLAALADASAYASLEDYAAAIDSAEANYNVLPSSLRAQIDTAPITDGRALIERINGMQQKINALPTSIAFADITAQTAYIGSVRAEYDALSAEDKALLDDTTLVNAEALILSTEAAYQPIADFNAKVAAFTVVQDSSRENIEAMIAGLDALKAELAAATFDKTYVDNAALTAKETEINALVSGYSATLTSESTDILAKITAATETCDSITSRIKSIEVPGDGTGASFDMDKISSYVSSYVSAMEEIIELIKNSEIFKLVPGYTDGAVEAAQNAIARAKAGREYGNDTVIDDTSKLSTFKGYFDSAKKYNSEISVAVNTVNEGVRDFLATWVAGSTASDGTAADAGTADSADTANGDGANAG